MLRLLFRFIGLLFLAAAFAALVVDGTRSIAAGAPAFLPLGRTISALSSTGFEKMRDYVQSHAPKLWDPVLVAVLDLPAWLVLGIVGLLLFALTRRRAPKIGYSRR